MSQGGVHSGTSPHRSSISEFDIKEDACQPDFTGGDSHEVLGIKLRREEIRKLES